MSRPDRACSPPRIRLPLPLFISLLLTATFAVSTPGSAQPSAWKSVSVGDDHACALDGAGRAYCWGNNHGWHLGSPTRIHCGVVSESGRRGCFPVASETVPLPAAGAMRFASLSAGRYVTCGVDADGRAFCWGNAMGDTAAYVKQCLHARRCSIAPVPLEPGRRFAAVDATARCAADREGAALCWGHEYREEADVSTPWSGHAVAAVTGDPESHTFCAVDRGGKAFCNGDASFGLVGNGSRDSAAAGPADFPGRFTQVAVLGFWACGLDTGGAAHCWGAAGYDDARANSAHTGFELCPRWGTQTLCNTRPARMAGAARFRSITAMPRGTMPITAEMVGITATGEAWVWGGDRVPRPWNPDRRWASVSAGDWGQCGVTTGGELYCWGRDPHEEVQGLIPHPP